MNFFVCRGQTLGSEAKPLRSITEVPAKTLRDRSGTNLEARSGFCSGAALVAPLHLSSVLLSSQGENHLHGGIDFHRLAVQHRRAGPPFHPSTAVIADAISGGGPEPYSSLSIEPSFEMMACKVTVPDTWADLAIVG